MGEECKRIVRELMAAEKELRFRASLSGCCADWGGSKLEVAQVSYDVALGKVKTYLDGRK